MQDLADFSKEHYTWINQIFGDQSVREIIGEEYPVEDTTFVVDPATDEFPDSDHHVLVTADGKMVQCRAGTPGPRLGTYTIRCVSRTA